MKDDDNVAIGDVPLFSNKMSPNQDKKGGKEQKGRENKRGRDRWIDG